VTPRGTSWHVPLFIGAHAAEHLTLSEFKLLVLDGCDKNTIFPNIDQEIKRTADNIDREIKLFWRTQSNGQVQL